MGWNRAELQVTARLSAHNDERDEQHEKLWDDLFRAVDALIKDPKYQDISPELY